MSCVRVSCLRCHHESLLTDAYLAPYGLDTGVSLVTLSRRLRCSRCDSQAVVIDRLPETPGASSPPTAPDS